MKVKTSVTLSEELLTALEGFGNRSQTIERAVRFFIQHHRRRIREARDRKILDKRADQLNREAFDVLDYQVDV